MSLLPAAGPLVHRRLARDVLSGRQLAPQLSNNPARSAMTWWWIVSMFSCAAATNTSPGASARRSTTPAIIARTQSSTKRGRWCGRSTTAALSLRFESHYPHWKLEYDVRRIVE